MTPHVYASLRRTALRATRRPDEADDLVQDALLEAVRAGRTEFGPADLRWLAGIVRNKARFVARSAARRSRRETDWVADGPAAAETGEPVSPAHILERLPAAQRAV